jgi:AhpD family alkylhydroperoxidase
MELKGLQAAPNTALPCKIKEIVGLAVASQLPSSALVYGHTQLARASGATQAELAEGVAIAGLTRHWSTFMNGSQLDEPKFRAEIARFVADAQKAMAAGTPPPATAPMKVVDAKGALAEIHQSLGLVPEFLSRFPAAGLPGAWTQERDVEFNPTTALSGKHKSLVGLAVAAQIPCRYCVIADTEFAKLEGATDGEITEAIAMGGLTRQWGTMMTGLAIDEGAYKKDMERIAKMIASPKKTETTAMTNTK